MQFKLYMGSQAPLAISFGFHVAGPQCWIIHSGVHSSFPHFWVLQTVREVSIDHFSLTRSSYILIPSMFPWVWGNKKNKAEYSLHNIFLTKWRVTFCRRAAHKSNNSLVGPKFHLGKDHPSFPNFSRHDNIEYSYFLVGRLQCTGGYYSYISMSPHLGSKYNYVLRDVLFGCCWTRIF